MALRKEKLEGFRQQLVDRREQLAVELRQATTDMINEDPFFADSIDQASADTDRNFTVALKNRQRGVLLQIDEALRRLDTGAYGDCVQCGDPIAEARIRAFPFTTLCIDCKAELESEEHRFPGRA